MRAGEVVYWARNMGTVGNMGTMGNMEMTTMTVTDNDSRLYITGLGVGGNASSCVGVSSGGDNWLYTTNGGNGNDNRLYVPGIGGVLDTACISGNGIRGVRGISFCKVTTGRHDMPYINLSAGHRDAMYHQGGTETVIGGNMTGGSTVNGSHIDMRMQGGMIRHHSRGRRGSVSIAAGGAGNAGSSDGAGSGTGNSAGAGADSSADSSAGDGTSAGSSDIGSGISDGIAGGIAGGHKDNDSQMMIMDRS